MNRMAAAGNRTLGQKGNCVWGSLGTLVTFTLWGLGTTHFGALRYLRT